MSCDECIFDLCLCEESWLNYYDIFVRNAFGNLRDVLREVTYNPIMGDYLTYKRNRAMDTCHFSMHCLFQPKLTPVSVFVPESHESGAFELCQSLFGTLDCFGLPRLDDSLTRTTHVRPANGQTVKSGTLPRPCLDDKTMANVCNHSE